MGFDISSFLYLGGVPLITGLVQLFKPFVKDTRFYPLIAVGCGLVLDVAVGLAVAQPWYVGLIMGLVSGLAGSGLYSAGSTLAEGAAAVKGNPAHKE